MKLKLLKVDYNVCKFAPNEAKSYCWYGIHVWGYKNKNMCSYTTSFIVSRVSCQGQKLVKQKVSKPLKTASTHVCPHQNTKHAYNTCTEYVHILYVYMRTIWTVHVLYKSTLLFEPRVRG